MEIYEDPSISCRSLRPDLTPFLFHFVRPEHPFEDWIRIISEQKIKSRHNGFVCFTDAPATMMYSLINYYQKDGGRFSNYAIGFNRIKMYRKGARPVFYGDERVKDLLPDELQWRYEFFDLKPMTSICEENKSKDYTWMREWRTFGPVFDFSDFADNEIILIAPPVDEIRTDAMAFRESHSDTLDHRNLKVFTWDKIAEMKDDNELSLKFLISCLR